MKKQRDPLGKGKKRNSKKVGLRENKIKIMM